MKRSRVSVLWEDGLHLRRATRLVERALAYRSSISLKVNDRLADARSILAVLMLGATFGTVVDLEISGTDEDAALAAITEVFDTDVAEPETAAASERKC